MSIALKRALCASCVSLAFGAASGPALADTPEAVSVEEIVVTAQRREQSLQDVPAAVTAFSSAALEAQSVQNLTDLSAKMPNVVLAPVGAFPYASAFFIRGLGFADVESTFEASVGTEMNGVYLARNSGALMDFFDIDSVEVLRGPQGTLYGRNTIGGVVSVRTKKPGREFGGEVQGTVGDHGRREVRLAVDAPINDIVGARLSMVHKNYDGYWYNETTGQDTGSNEVLSGRLTIRAEPTDTFDVTLTLDATTERGDGAGFTNLSVTGMAFAGLPGGPEDPTRKKSPYTIYSNPTYANIDAWGVGLQANWDLGFGTVTSITGYREFDDSTLTDFDASELVGFHAYRDQTHYQFSQEVRLASNGENRLNYVVGAYFLDQEYKLDMLLVSDLFPFLEGNQITSQKNRAWAAFGQADYALTDQLTITFGGRYSYEEKEFRNKPGSLPDSQTHKANWNDFSPKLGVSYAWSSELMGYAQWSRGFRSGGFNGRAASHTSAGPYDAETVDSFELGFKSELFDRRLRLNAAAFSSTYSDMQTSVQGMTSAGAYEAVTLNAGEGRIDGVELEAVFAAGHGLTLNASLAYLDARFEENFTDLSQDGVDNPTDNTDLPFGYAPEWSGSIGATYVRDLSFGTLTAAANVVYTGDMWTSGGVLTRTSDVLLRPANTVVDANISLEGNSGWRVSLWGKNLGDKEQLNNAWTVGLGVPGVYAAPRTYGIDIGYKF